MLDVKRPGEINMAMAISPSTIVNKAGRKPQIRATTTDARPKGEASKIGINEI
jgi:hypothetical protein